MQSTRRKPPTSKDITPVTLSKIPHIEPSAFQNYLSQIQSISEAFQRPGSGSDSGDAQAFHQGISSGQNHPFPHSVGYEEKKHSSTSCSSQQIGTPRLPLPADTPARWRHSPYSSYDRLTPIPLSTIPSIYFDEKFRLENPRVFDLITEHAEIARQSQLTIDGEGATDGTTGSSSEYLRKALATNVILQEKLSWYMDTVEAHLEVLTSDASIPFFAAIGSLDELHAEVTDLVVKTQKVRKELATLDEEVAIHGIKLNSQKQKRDNVQVMGNLVRQLRGVLGGVRHCEDLVASGQLDIAINHIFYVEQLISGKLDPTDHSYLHWLLPTPPIRLIDLRRMPALGGLLQQIHEIRQRIGSGYKSRLRDVLLHDMRHSMSCVPPKDTLLRWSNTAKRARGATIPSTMMQVHTMSVDKLRNEIIPILQGLGQTRHLAGASTTIRQAVIREIKSIIRQYIPSSTENDDQSVASTSTRASGRQSTLQERSSILSRNLRALSPQDYEDFLVNVYCRISQAIQQLSAQIKVLLDVTGGIERPPVDTYTIHPQSFPGITDFAVDSPGRLMERDLKEEPTTALDMLSLLGQAVEKAQSEITKVLRVRTEQIVSSGLSYFLRYVTLNRLFAHECETVSGYSRTALRDVVKNQIQNFISCLQETEGQKLAQKMEAEKWECINFSTEDTTVLTHIIESITIDPPLWIHYGDVTSTALEVFSARNLQTSETAAIPPSASNEDKQPWTSAIIEEETFMLVDSAAFALRGIEQYMILLTLIPSMATDISKALLNYIKLYNSRTHQLILGAGARQTAGLTNINAKHLALASQSLSFFSALIPYLRESVRRRSSITASEVSEYDQLKRLLQDHQSSIHNTLIDIMKNRAASYTRAMENTDWDSGHDITRNASTHMETLVKDTLKLRRTLSKFLPTSSARMIIDNVLVNYQEQLSKTFHDIEIRTEAGKARLLRDAELLKEKLDKMSGAEELGTHLVSVVRAKQVTSQPKASTTSPSDEARPT